MPQSVSDWDWSAILELAGRTKTLGLLCKVAADSGLELPADVAKELDIKQRELLVASLFNLEWTIKVVKAVRDAGIDTLVLKGPIQSSLVYGRWDIHRSMDVDLLVRPADFKAAGEALGADGFLPALEDSDQWWADHLGEAPFYNSKVSSPVVDLHHRVQQPGGPFPKDPERFFADCAITKYGNVDLPVLSREHGAVLAAISYGKALAEGASWMHYAHELVTVYTGLSEAERAKLQDLAVFHGVHRLLDDALRAAQELFAPKSGSETGLDGDDRERLLESACGLRPRQRLFRSRKLWAWTDGALPERVVEFGRGLMRVWQSEMARMAQEKEDAARAERTA